jgi:hypothetical protein
LPVSTIEPYIQNRDVKVATKSGIITNPGSFIQLLIWIIRLGERGSVAEKIKKLKFNS